MDDLTVLPPDEPTRPPVDLARPPEIEPSSVAIGPWRVLSKLGEGGFGVVYLAEQDQPRRRAAVKLIKPGMDSRAVLLRFEAERQSLAMMTHPHIARLYDAGLHDSRPYFAMEFVDGGPITTYCDEHRLTLPQRLRLFQDVCHAVQHAHLKGIVHRDLSARNVLVAHVDGKPVAKVIDFGIAKALTAGDATNETTEGSAIGSYAYMSPEQLSGDADVDTRTDVYSLGILLYELICGVRPYNVAALKQESDLALRRAILDAEPTPPARCFQSSPDRAAIAAARGLTPEAIAKVLRSELAWIPLKALRKERDRRYDSPAGLAGDIDAYLSHRPLIAAPESRLYLTRKFLRRHRVAVVAATAVTAAVLAGAGVSIHFGVQATRARDAALAAQARESEQRAEAERQRAAAEVSAREASAQRDEAERQRTAADANAREAAAQRDEARRQAAIAAAVSSFQQNMLASANPNNLLGDKLTVVQAMQIAVEELDAGALRDQPLVEAAVRMAVGSTFAALARFAEAEALMREAVRIQRKALPAVHPDIAASLNELATVLRLQGRTAEAEPLQREALQVWREARPVGHPDIAMGLINLAIILRDQNRLAEAEPLFRDAVDILRKALPPEHPDIAQGLDNLASVLADLNRPAEAEALYRQALALRRKGLPPGHPDIATNLGNLAALLRACDRPVEAEPLFREALQINRNALPVGHPDIATSLNNLAGLLTELSRLSEAEPLYREALDISRKALPPGHPNIATGLNNLGSLLMARNSPAEAEPMFRAALDIYRQALPAGHPGLAAALTNLAAVLQDQDKPAEAEPLYREALDINRKALPPGHPSIANSLVNLASLLQALSRPAEAEPLFREALDTREKNHGPTDARTCRSAFYLAQTLDALARPDEAQAIRRKYRLGDPATRPGAVPAPGPATLPTTRP